MGRRQRAGEPCQHVQKKVEEKSWSNSDSGIKDTPTVCAWWCWEDALKPEECRSGEQGPNPDPALPAARPDQRCHSRAL